MAAHTFVVTCVFKNTTNCHNEHDGLKRAALSHTYQWLEPGRGLRIIMAFGTNILLTTGLKLVVCTFLLFSYHAVQIIYISGELFIEFLKVLDKSAIFLPQKGLLLYV